MMMNKLRKFLLLRLKVTLKVLGLKMMMMKMITKIHHLVFSLLLKKMTRMAKRVEDLHRLLHLPSVASFSICIYGSISGTTVICRLGKVKVANKNLSPVFFLGSDRSNYPKEFH